MRTQTPGMCRCGNVLLLSRSVLHHRRMKHTSAYAMLKECCASAQWLLGFIDEADPAALLRHRFPSKVGGRPVRYMRSAVQTCMFVP
jgi:hypothetical protein